MSAVTYEGLQRALEAAGCATTIQSSSGLRQLVCAARRTRHGLEGNSFWLARTPGGAWVAATWAGEDFWQLPSENGPEELVMVCHSLLDASSDTMYRLPAELVARYSLVPTEGDPFAEEADAPP